MKPMLKLLSCVLIVAGVFCATTYTECRLSDIKSVIGGKSYTVHDMRGLTFFHSEREQLFLYGNFTDIANQKTSTFVMLYDPLFCESRQIFQLDMQEIGDAQYYNNTIYLLGLNQVNRSEFRYTDIIVRIKLQVDLDQGLYVKMDKMVSVLEEQLEQALLLLNLQDFGWLVVYENLVKQIEFNLGDNSSLNT